MVSHSTRVFIKGLVLSLGIVLYFSVPTHAATITVDTTAVTGSASECSLQDALTAANTNTAVNGCVAGDSLPITDIIALPAGTFNIGNSYTMQPSESVSIHGAGMAATTLADANIEPITDAVLDRAFELRNLTLTNTTVTLYDSVSTFTVDHVKLDNSMINVYQTSKSATSTLSNISAVNGSTLNEYAQISNPGSIIVQNSEFDGAGSASPAISHTNLLANGRIDVVNTVITNYEIGIYNQECAYGNIALRSMYVTNTMVGGGNMKQGIINACGHLVVDSSTFHDIQGAAILASANFQTVDKTDTGLVCHEQLSSHIELTNSTFSQINVTGAFQPLLANTSTPPAAVPHNGVITIDSSLNPECFGTTQVTNTDISLLHTTFAGNIFTNAGSANIGVMDGTVLRNFVLRNNALQGNAITGTFSASGTIDVANNLTTASYAGPGPFASGFSTIADFLLGPLQDNGGVAAIGVDGASGHVLTMRPLAGSPLIDAAPSAGLASDQRGETRSLLARYDVGAVEVTLAEFTADGGVYNPGSATTGRLAETGENIWMAVVAGGGMILFSLLVLKGLRQGSFIDFL